MGMKGGGEEEGEASTLQHPHLRRSRAVRLLKAAAGRCWLQCRAPELPVQDWKTNTLAKWKHTFIS